MLSNIEMRGCIKSTPEKYKDLEDKKCNVSIILEDNKANDKVIFKILDKEIVVPKYLWHETTEKGKVRICTSSGVFKIYLN